MSSDRAVVITGMGVCSPAGFGSDALRSLLRTGECRVAPITRFDVSGYRSSVAAEVPEEAEAAAIQAGRLVGVQVTPRYGRAALYGLGALAEALESAGLAGEDFAEPSLGLVFGGSTAGTLEAEEPLLNGPEEGDYFDRVPADRFLLSPVGSTASILAHVLGMTGPVSTVSTACSSAANALGTAMSWLRSGRCTRVIAGGSDALCRLTHAGFNSLSLVDPRRPLPFDVRREGMSIGEGAAFFVLEDSQRARARGARLLAQLSGFGAISEAHHLVQPRADGEGAAAAMRAALLDAGVDPQRVDYINAHGTATPHNDLAEARGIAALFGARAVDLPVSSTKSQIGHLLGASAGVELAACVLALQHGFLPPTSGWEERDPEIPLEDFVPGQARAQQVEVILSNSFAFGGNDASLCLERV